MQAKEYRPDIDVLRAIAVLAVVLYHAHIPFFNGGYIGVDIFFVISGYLITGIIKRKLTNNTFSILEFYENRIRRILPALFVMFCIVFLIFAYFAVDNLEIYALRRTTKRALFAISNIHFYLHTGYFDQAAERIPMLHTWSLAVEEQFYFIIPSLLIVLYKFENKINTLYILYILTVLSFICSVILVHYDQKFAFYMLPTRAWELLIGSLLAYTEWTPKTQKAKTFCILLGLCLMVFSIIFFGDNSFPGFWALFPCLGAFFYIAGGTQYIYIYRKSLLHYIINNKPLIFIGVISYSLYLWHWPIFVFFFDLASKPSLNFSLSLIFLSFILAILSWRFIERPVRLSPLFKKRKILWTCTLICFAILFTLTDKIKTPLKETGSNYPFEISAIYKQTENFAANTENSKTSVFLLGDSHAMAQASMILDKTKEKDISSIFRKATPKNYNTSSPKEKIKEWEKVTYLLQNNNPENLFIIYRFISYLSLGYESKNKKSTLTHINFPQLSPEETTYKSLEETILEAKKYGVKNIFIQLPLPEPYKDVPNFAHKMESILNYTEQEINNELGESIEDYNKRAGSTLKILYTLKQKYPEIHLIDPRPYFLNEKKNRYLAVKNYHSLFIDDDHLSVEGSNLLVPLYQEIFNDIKNNTIKQNY